MKNNQIKQEFIIKSLKPYFEDINNCGFDTDEVICKYETHDGKKCVVGQYLNTDIFRNSRSTFSIICSEYHDFNDILVDEAKNMLTVTEWRELQFLHDDLGQNGYNIDNMKYISDIEELAEVDLTELKQMLPNYEPIIF